MSRSDFFDSDSSFYRTKEIIQSYPHTSDFQEDQANCDEFGYQLIPVHAERWWDHHKLTFERNRNAQMLEKGQEVLSFLSRKADLSNEQLRCLALAITHSLYESEGLGIVHELIGGIEDNARYSECEEYCPEDVPGIIEPSYFNDVFNIFPSKYDPLPDLSGYSRLRVGLSDKRVPTNTSLEEAVIEPTVGSVTLNDVRRSQFGSHKPRVI